MKKCLVLGGDGFIGSHLVESLVKNKFQVTVFSLGSKQGYKNLSQIKNSVEYIKGNFYDTSSLNKIIQPNSYVINLISTSIPSSPAIDTIESLKPQIELIEACCNKKIKKYIFASSGGGVYGDKQKLPITEKSLPHPASPHAIGKITIEYFLHYYHKTKKLPYVIYRFSNPYGPRQIPKKGFGLIPTLFNHIINNTTPTLFDNGNAIRDFIYIKDLVNTVTNSFYKKNKYPVYNVGSGKGVKISKIWKLIKKITNTNIYPILKPRREFDVKKYILDSSRFSQEFELNNKTDLKTGLSLTWDWIIQTL